MRFALIDQDFAATGPDQKWGVDISYIWTRETKSTEGQRWLYLAVVIELFARRVVGWATGDRLHCDLALVAHRKALIIRCPPEALDPSFGPRQQSNLCRLRKLACNIVQSITKLSCTKTALSYRFQAKVIVTTMPWSKLAQ